LKWNSLSIAIIPLKKTIFVRINKYNGKDLRKVINNEAKKEEIEAKDLLTTIK